MKGFASGAEPWVLPKGWRWEPLQAVAPVNPKRTLEGLSDEDEIAFVPMAAVAEESGKIDVSQRRSGKAVRTGYTRFWPGDVIFAKITPCMENGKIAVIPDLSPAVGAGSTEFHVLEPLDVEPRYLFYWLTQRSFRRAAEFNMTGTAGQKRVPSDYMRSALIPVPGRDEQRRIVARIDELFSELDDGEEELARARADLETYRKALLKAAVTGELTAHWREANPSQQTGADLLSSILHERRRAWHASSRNRRKRYEDPNKADATSLPVLPPSWTWASLDQLSWASAYGTSQKCAVDAVGEPVLRIPNLKRGAVDVGDLKRSLVPLGLRAEEYVVPGDLLIVRTNGSEDLIGRTGILSSALPAATHYASYLIRFRMTGGTERWRWIRAFTESPVFRASVLASIGSSAGQYNLSMSKLAAFPVAVPPDREIAEVLRHWRDADMELNDDLSEESNTLRQSILAAAFRGELL